MLNLFDGDHDNAMDHGNLFDALGNGAHPVTEGESVHTILQALICLLTIKSQAPRHGLKALVDGGAVG